MKFLTPLVFCAAFFAQALAEPMPQTTDVTTRLCTTDGRIPCPSGYHCCPKTVSSDGQCGILGYCLFFGALCLNPTPV
ncbi:hypothetical protein BDN70DRAFT_877692 [Pholiota conissans]|uniref:Granulins domain-containing protein n=1 Tax=Pholiota conissans TaxID=109636 RepID=A0A9P6CV51_9AGAR|nr:hypothetical protein BDN70DRAFT_877692 [Pholiota conissans]